MSNQSKLLCQRVSDVIKRDFNTGYWFNTTLPKHHTYCLVFSLYQTRALEVLKKEPSIKILYESPMAINTYHGGRTNQQSIVVFEFNE